jgi:hypothetical protein
VQKTPFEIEKNWENHIFGKGIKKKIEKKRKKTGTGCARVS